MLACRLTLLVSLVGGAVTLAQVQIDDHPKPIDDGKPLTKKELDRRKADQLLRDARTRYGLGIISQRHERLIEAVGSLEKAAALDPESLEIKRALIPLYATIGRDGDAQIAAAQVIDQDSFDLETAFVYGRLLRANGKAADAIPVLQKAIDGKDAKERPERLLFVLTDLVDLLDKQGDFAGVAKAQDEIIRTIAEKREQLLFGNGLTREDLFAAQAKAYEGLGRACVKTKEYDRAVAAFHGARDSLLKCEDPEARHQAVRISFNLSEVAAAQGRWADALEALDSYLDHGPAEVTPYETKIELLRKLKREREIVPALRKYAAKEEFHLGLQLLLARELAKDPRTRGEAEELYTRLLKTNVKPEVYRGLFQLYQVDKRMAKVLDLMDEAWKVIGSEDPSVTSSDRESAGVRSQAMTAAVRTDRPLALALVDQAHQEAGQELKREIRTWLVVGSLAVSAHEPSRAESAFRQCLINPGKDEFRIYQGLIHVLRMQRKFGDIVSICRDGLRRNKDDLGIQMLLRPGMADALAQLGRYDEAIDQIDRAIALKGEEQKVIVRCEKANILAQAARYDDAVRVCEDALKELTRTKDVITVRISLSGAYSARGDHEKSEEQLRLILQIDPEFALANNNLGYQMADRNTNLDEAEQLIRKSIDLYRTQPKDLGAEDDNAAYLDSLGWVLFRKGKLPEAREWLEKAVALPEGENDPTVWDHLGDVFAKSNEPVRAKDAWKKALERYDVSPRSKSDPRRNEIEKKLKTLE
jgi:tetratricopeptide (TPR) repeat protein